MSLRLLFLASPSGTHPRVHEAWLLRRALLATTPPEDEDRETFTSHVCGPDRALACFIDRGERLRGFFSVGLVPLNERPRGLVLVSKYFYFEAGYRGHPLTLIAPYRAVLWGLCRHGWRTTYFATTAFPQSYCSLARSTGALVSLRDPDVPPPARRALVAFCEAFHPLDFDREAGLVRSRTVPAGVDASRSPPTRALAARYEGLNPRRRDGLALPVAFRVDGRVVAHALVQLASRTRRSAPGGRRKAARRSSELRASTPAARPPGRS